MTESNKSPIERLWIWLQQLYSDNRRLRNDVALYSDWVNFNGHVISTCVPISIKHITYVAFIHGFVGYVSNYFFYSHTVPPPSSYLYIYTYVYFYHIPTSLSISFILDSGLSFLFLLVYTFSLYIILVLWVFNFNILIQSYYESITISTCIALPVISGMHCVRSISHPTSFYRSSLYFFLFPFYLCSIFNLSLPSFPLILHIWTPPAPPVYVYSYGCVGSFLVF